MWFVCFPCLLSYSQINTKGETTGSSQPMKTEDTCTYTILIRGQVGEDEINSTSPIHLTVEPCANSTMLLTAQTDQSGMIGLIRHLNGMGFILITITREDGQKIEGN